MFYKINPLHDDFGAEISGIQLNSKMEAKDIAQLQSLILEHKVVVFKNQELTPEEQISTCRLFGEIEPHPLQENTCPYKEMSIISNVSQDGEALGYPGPKFDLWHSDMCYETKPPKFSFLYAEKVPHVGGNTLFANTTKAYKDMDSELKEKINQLEAVFGFSENLMSRCHELGYTLNIDECDRRPDVIHPIVRTHPLTGKKSIFVNWTHTDKVIGLGKDESDTLLRQLYDFYTQKKYIYSHKYDLNDLIVWDNSATIHTGDGTVEIDKPRIMRRVVVKHT